MVYHPYQLNLNLTLTTMQASVRLLYMFDRSTINDWQYDGLAVGNNVLTNAAGTVREYYLDSDPAQSYTVRTIAAFFQHKL